MTECHLTRRYGMAGSFMMPLAPQSNSSKTPSLMAFTRKPLLRTANSLCIPKARSCFCRDLDPKLARACTVTCTGDHSYTKSSTTSCSMSFAQTHADPLSHQ